MFAYVPVGLHDNECKNIAGIGRLVIPWALMGYGSIISLLIYGDA